MHFCSFPRYYQRSSPPFVTLSDFVVGIFFSQKIKMFHQIKKIPTNTKIDNTDKMENTDNMRTELETESDESSVESSVESELPVFKKKQGMRNDLCNVSPISSEVEEINVSIFYMAGPFLVVQPNDRADNLKIKTRGSSGPSVCSQIATNIFEKLAFKNTVPAVVNNVKIKDQFRKILEGGEQDAEGQEIVPRKDGLLSKYTQYPKLVLFRQGKAYMTNEDGTRGEVDKTKSRLVVIMRLYGSHIEGRTIKSIDDAKILPPREGGDLFLRSAMIQAALEIARSDLNAIQNSDVARNARVARDKENKGRLGRVAVSLKNPTRTAKKIAKNVAKGGAVAAGALAGAYYGKDLIDKAQKRYNAGKLNNGTQNMSK